MPFVPGQEIGADITPGTSGQVIHGDILTIPLPLVGQQTLRLGSERNGYIPIAVRADSLMLQRIPIGLACGCLRGVAYRTCGGTLYEADGVSPSPNCTEGYGGGGSGLCVGKKPCTAAFGAENSAQGVIGCNGLAPINFTVAQNSGGASGHPGPAVTSWNGTGGSGSAAMYSASSLGIVVGLCTAPTSTYGPDGEFCTPSATFALPDLVEEELVTQFPPPCSLTQVPTVSICVANVGSAAAGPFSVSGQIQGARYEFFRLEGLGDGEQRCIEPSYFPLDAEIMVTLDSNNEVQESNEDNNTRWDFVSFFPIPTCTPAPTPTPPAILPPLCIGDCNGDGTVTIDELITGISMALGDTPPYACSAFCFTGCQPGPAFRPPTVVCLTRAVTYTLDGCPAPCATDEDCDPANKCSSHQCTLTGRQYRCLCH